MNFRTTAVLFGLVFAFGLVLLVLTFTGDSESAPTGALVEELADAGVKADQVEAVEVERTTNPPAKLKLTRTGKDAWKIEEPIQARADAGAVDRLVSALFSARPTSYPELSTNPAIHGLAPPGLRVTLRGGGKQSTVNVGEVTFGGKAVAFVTTSSRSRPMAVPVSELSALLKDNSLKSGGPAGDLAKWTNDYRNKQVFTVDTRTGADDVTAVRLAAKGKELALSKVGGEWKFDQPAGWGEAALNGDPSASATAGGITGVRPLLNAVVNLQAQAADDFIDQPKDLKEYGLNPDNPDRVKVEIKPKDGPAEVAYIGKKVEDAAPPPAFGAPPAGKVYVMIEGQPGVIRANAGEPVTGLAALAADPSPLRDRDLLRDDTRNRADAIDVTTGGQTVKLRKTPGSPDWKLYGGPGDPQEANQEAARKLLDLLAQPRVVKDFPAPNDANFAGQELKAEVKLWADGVEPNTDPKADPKAEPKLKGNPTTFQFGKKDSAGVYVRRILPTGAKNDFILPEKVKVGTDAEPSEVLAAATRNRLGYLDPTLPTFAQTQAARLTVTQGQVVTYEVAAEKTAGSAIPGAAWKFAKPDARKDRPADAGTIGDLLNVLATQRAGAFVKEQPTKEDLLKYGLLTENPRLRAEVALDTGTPPADDKKDEKDKDKKDEKKDAAKDKDKTRAYYLGNETDDKQSVYARVEGRDAVFTVPKFLYERFATADLRDKTVVRFDKSKVKAVKLRGWKQATGVPTAYEFEKQGGVWTAKAPAGFPVDGGKVDAFLGLLDGLRAKAFVPGGAKPEHGFDPGADGLEVTVEVEGGPAVALAVGAATDTGNSYFVRVNSLPPAEQVVTAQSDPFKPYKEKPAAFAK